MLFPGNRIPIRDKDPCRVLRGFYKSNTVLVPVQDGVYHAPQHCLAVARRHTFRQTHGIQFIFVFRKECQRLVHLLICTNCVENPDGRCQRITEHLFTDIVRRVHEDVYRNPFVIKVKAWVALDAALCDTLRHSTVLLHGINTPLHAAFIEVEGRCHIFFFRSIDIRQSLYGSSKCVPALLAE